MNRIALFRLLRRNNQLDFRRSPAFEQGVVAKVLMGIGGAFFVFYLLLYGTMFAAIATGAHEPAMVVGLIPFMLILDFGIRFMVQQTPAMLMKPYVLLPLPRHSVIDTFIVSSLLSIYNWLWLCFFIPYVIIVLAGGCGWLIGLSLLLSGIFVIMANSQFYLIVRTLVSRSMLWWIMPIVVYGAYLLQLAIDTKGDLFEDEMDALVAFGETPWLLLAIIVMLAVVLIINRKLQYRFACEEVSRQDKTSSSTMKHVYRFSFLDSYGEVGEYLKLEMKSIFRNKAIRGRFISSLSLIVIFTALISFTSIYDGRLMLNFWCFYCFSIFGLTTLTKIMGPEGNYIDLLMTHRENILSLLRAKYYFHCAVLLVPVVIMLPAVIEGKFSWQMILAYLFMSTGLLFFIMFQLAVTNCQTLPLDQKITGKGNFENGLQLTLEMVAMLLPITLVAILLLFFDDTTAYLVLMVIGLLFTITHPIWLKNIYRRMMKRKYVNLDGFHASR